MPDRANLPWLPTRDAIFCPDRKLAGKLHDLGLGNAAKIG
jgi:hypothetical protein